MKPEKIIAKYKAITKKKKQEKLFEKKDMVLVYFRKERILTGAYNKLKPKKYGPFKIVMKINDNAYVENLSSDMAMSKTVKVTDLDEYHPTDHLYPDNNSRTCSFEKERTDIGDQSRNKSADQDIKLSCL